MDLPSGVSKPLATDFRTLTDVGFDGLAMEATMFQEIMDAAQAEFGVGSLLGEVRSSEAGVQHTAHEVQYGVYSDVTNASEIFPVSKAPIHQPATHGGPESWPAQVPEVYIVQGGTENAREVQITHRNVKPDRNTGADDSTIGTEDWMVERKRKQNNGPALDSQAKKVKMDNPL